MRPTIYLDTSVYGGYFDKEFEEFTIPLFERINNLDFVLCYSDLVQEELNNSPSKVKELVQSINSKITLNISTTDEALNLAKSYIDEKVVGKTSFADCLHIAMATIHKVDYLISWNFKHIVNVDRIRGYNSINLKYGYSILEIRSPREFLK